MSGNAYFNAYLCFIDGRIVSPNDIQSPECNYTRDDFRVVVVGRVREIHALGTTGNYASNRQYRNRNSELFKAACTFGLSCPEGELAEGFHKCKRSDVCFLDSILIL
jgi:hypothetical protein